MALISQIAFFLTIAAAIFSVIELGLSAYIASLFNGTGWGFAGRGSRSPDVVNFIIFNSIWSLLVLVYIGVTPLYATRVFHRLAAFALNVVTAIFWFAGAVALAVATGTGSCYGDRLCQTAKAATAFAFFLWVIFTALAVFDGLNSFGKGRHEDPTPAPHGAKHGHTQAYPGV